MYNKEELSPIVNEDGIITGVILRGEAHNSPKTSHLAVHLDVFNSNGDLCLRKRPLWKNVKPNRWDTTTGSQVNIVEDIEQAPKREVKEISGLTDYAHKFLGKYFFENDIERELIFLYKTSYDGKINPSRYELTGGRFWTNNNIERGIGYNIFSQYFESKYQYFFECRL